MLHFRDTTTQLWQCLTYLVFHSALKKRSNPCAANKRHQLLQSGRKIPSHLRFCHISEGMLGGNVSPLRIHAHTDHSY